MNNTEAEYAWKLEAMKADGTITGYGFEADRLQIAPGSHYKPDFRVDYNDGHIEYHEIKGGLIREAAVVRFK